ncbi:MAG: DUF1385 domain-containing protein [Clostridiales bacterium]|nr:DUF1385 domain-containing protein [Clostridiales bacterium]
MGKKNCFRTTIGGQALLEGIMMRGPERQSVVVRKADGTLITKTDELNIKKHKILKLPFIRGPVNFFYSMKDGVKSLMYSADIAMEDIPEDDTKPTFLERKLGRKKADELMMTVSVVLGVALPVALFILLPTLVAGLFDSFLTGIWISLFEGVLRIIIFLIFIISTSFMKDIKRTYMYHGAEHKTIHCYENALELTVENVRHFPKAHPRCGTSFLFVVMIVSIIVFSFVRWSNPIIRMVLRLALLPVVVSISYEFNRFVGRHDNKLTKFLRAPGLALQRFTTIEPDDSMIEVAIEALKNVIPETEGTDKW